MKKATFLTTLLTTVLLGLTLIQSCKKEAGETMAVYLPANFPTTTYNLASNPVSYNGFMLGKKLFYDPILSQNNTISCGTCHIPFSAFTQHGHALSHGIHDLLGRRNSMPLFNLAWSKDFFWDGGVHQLDLVPFNPIQNPVEMDETVANVIAKLNNEPTYKQMFQAAFGSSNINTQTFTKALSQFMLCLVSANSKYDKYVRHEENTSLNNDELAGLNLYQTKCRSCHATDLFTDHSFRNNGLNASFAHDQGRYEATLIPGDMGKFKVPSLRNLKYTSPYMHDGSMASLSEVLDHYSNGVKPSATLDPLLTNGIALTVTEKQQLLAFLNTLNDEHFIKDVRFQEE